MNTSKFVNGVLFDEFTTYKQFKVGELNTRLSGDVWVTVKVEGPLPGYASLVFDEETRMPKRVWRNVSWRVTQVRVKKFRDRKKEGKGERK